jgi:hypothetical protein
LPLFLLATLLYSNFYLGTCTLRLRFYYNWFQKLRSDSRAPLASGISLLILNIDVLNKRGAIEKAQSATDSGG